MSAAMDMLWERADADFFRRYPSRKARIRKPWVDGSTTECHGEFWSLGDHDKDRRRIILWRVPEDNPFYDKIKQPLLKIPFLAFADETIEDTDENLLPVIDDIMKDAAEKMS